MPLAPVEYALVAIKLIANRNHIGFGEPARSIGRQGIACKAVVVEMFKGNHVL